MSQVYYNIEFRSIIQTLSNYMKFTMKRPSCT